MRDLVDMTAPLMTAQGLSFSAGGARLIRDVDLALSEGRITLLMGANGAGKSLLLRLLHGLLRPDAGVLSWRGGAMDAAARRAQAMAFQRPVLLRRSARANLRFAARALRVPRAERTERVETALAEARLSEIADRPARRLSGGEQQRLALARALIGRPTMLFLDEPTASLDPASTALIENQIRAAHAAGTTVLMATHDKGQSVRLGQEIIFMDAGRIAESGSARTVLTAPVSEPARAWMAGRLHHPSKPEEVS